MKAVTPDVARFRALVGRRLGFREDELEPTELALVFAERLALTHAASFDEYAATFEGPHGAAIEDAELARRLTVGETYFFRYAAQIRSFGEGLTAAAARARRESRVVRVVSAGCATGEEPYSLAIEAAERGVREIEILGIDVNPTFLARARRASYSPWALRELAPRRVERYFRRRGAGYDLDPAVCGAVRFESRNLVDDDPGFWREGAFDFIFCRNVLIYFDAAIAAGVVARLERSLAPAGVLYFGHAEALRPGTTSLVARESGGAFQYERPSAGAPAGPALRGGAADGRGDAAPRHGAAVGTGPHGRRGPGRVAAESRSHHEPPSDASVARRGPAPAHTSHLPPEGSAIARGTGSASEASLAPRAAERRASRRDEAPTRREPLTPQGDGPEQAAAYYLRALGRLERGDHVDAAVDCERAARADPSFALPHLQLGLIAAQHGHARDARRELGEALRLLPGETDDRLAHYGGGFPRETLVRVCGQALARLNEGT